jgi:hypothetical protein
MEKAIKSQMKKKEGMNTKESHSIEIFRTKNKRLDSK